VRGRQGARGGKEGEREVGRGWEGGREETGGSGLDRINVLDGGKYQSHFTGAYRLGA
jgi:hypothetical protein